MPVEPSAPPVADGFAKRRPMSSAVVPTTGTRTVFLDVDGTLVTYENVLPDSAAWAIREARRAGHRVYACTGAPAQRCRRRSGRSGWTGDRRERRLRGGRRRGPPAPAPVGPPSASRRCRGSGAEAWSPTWRRTQACTPPPHFVTRPGRRSAPTPPARMRLAPAAWRSTTSYRAWSSLTSWYAMTSTRSAFCWPLLRTIWRRLVASSLTWSSAPGVAVATSRSSGT